MKYNVIIPAAGSGSRMQAGVNKQFLHIDYEPLIVHTVRFFERDEHCQQIVLIAQKEEQHKMKQLMEHHECYKVKAVVEGGLERQESVYNGLLSLHDDSIVLIHDGARPFVSKEMIRTLVKEAKKIGAATVGVRVKDTIKRVNEGRVVETLNRDELWAIQTPQAFKLSLLKDAHDQAKESKYNGTDDASLVEWLGNEVAVVEGNYENIKLTTPEDLLYAEMIMKKRREKK